MDDLIALARQGATRRPIISRPRSSRVCPRSAAAAPVAASPAPSRSRMSVRGRASPRVSGLTSSSSTGAARRSPPIAAGARVLVVGAQQDPAVATGYLNAYRHLIADLVVLTSADEESVERLRAASAAVVRGGVRVIGASLRPRPLAPVAGKRVAYFGAAPVGAHDAIAAHLRDAHGAEVVAVSGSAGRPG